MRVWALHIPLFYMIGIIVVFHRAKGRLRKPYIQKKSP